METRNRDEALRPLGSEQAGKAHILPRAGTDVAIYDGGVRFKGTLTIPEGAHSIVLFAQGSGRRNPRNRYLAERLTEEGIATLVVDLLEEREAEDHTRLFDIGLLSRRLIRATESLLQDERLKDLAIGYFGAGTGAAAALRAAAERPDGVGAIVSRGGRPDLAHEFLDRVEAPTLLIVGGSDLQVIPLNRMALAELRCDKDMNIIPGAGHLFEESGALEIVADRAVQWFTYRLRSPAARGAREHPSTRSPDPWANR